MARGCASGCSDTRKPPMVPPSIAPWQVSACPNMYNDTPNPIDWIAVAVGIISRSCPLIYDEPFLVKYKQRKPKEVQRDAKTVTKLARSERTREKERELYRELSRYFQVKKEGKPWNTTSLLVTGECDVIVQNTMSIPLT